MEQEATLPRRHIAILIAFFAVTFPLWNNAYLAAPDSASYFSWARTLGRGLDLDFINDYAAFRYEVYQTYLSDAGRVSNDWPIGSGLAWFPAWLAADALARIAAALGIENPLLQPTGQSGIYKLLVTLVSATFTIGALVVGGLMAPGSRQGSPRHTGWLVAALTVLLGTPVGFYTYAHSMMSHSTSMLAVGLLLWRCHATLKERSVRDWAILGALGGIVALVRPQDAAFLSVFLVELAMGPPRSRAQVIAWTKGVGVAAACALWMFASQMVAWWCLYGNPLSLPKIEEMHWFAPEIVEFLFSEYHGMLSWSPVLALVPVGLAMLWRRDRVLAAGLAVALVLQVYLNAANEIWWGSGSLGARRMISGGTAFVVALAAVVGGVRSAMSVPLLAVLSLWNLLLWARERAGLLSLDHYVPWNSDFFRGVLSMALPWKFFPAMMGDCAGFGWPTRIVLMAVGMGVSFSILRRGSPSARWRIAGYAALAWFAAMPFVVGVAALRTPTYGEDDLAVKPPRRALILYNGYQEYGFYRMMKRDAEGALSAFEKARAMRPEHPFAYRYIATVHLHLMNDPETALVYTDQALNISKDYGPALDVMAEAVQAVIDRDRSRVDLVDRLAERYRAANRPDDVKRVEEFKAQITK